MEVKTGTRPDVVLEATGNYSKPISCFFEESGYNVVILNPIKTHILKAKSIRKVKTDPIDANRIAQVYYLDDVSYHVPIPEDILDLRNLCRLYDSLNCIYVESQHRLHSILDLVFPNFHKVFNHICCKSSLELICSYPSPQSILSADREDLVNILRSSKHSIRWINEKVDNLLAAARESLPCNVSKQSNIRVLKNYVNILVTQQNALADTRDLIITQANVSPLFSLLKSIPGVGNLTAASILSEIGDIHRFKTEKQLIAYAGLDPSVFESDKFKSRNNKVSKRGSHYLRKALYQATVAGISKRKNGAANSVLYEFYTKKLAEGKASKVAITAASSKLLRFVFGMLKKGQYFRNNH
jgi:transposase